MKNYPEEFKKYKIGMLDLIVNEASNYHWQYQKIHGVESVNPDEISEADKYMSKKLEKYAERTNNARLLCQDGLILFAPDNGYSFEQNLLLGKTWNQLKSEGKVEIINNPEYDRLEDIFRDVLGSFRGVVKINVSRSLTKFALKTLKKGSYDIRLPDFWNGGSERINLEKTNIKLDGSSISYDTLFPDDFGFHKDLTHRLIKLMQIRDILTRMDLSGYATLWKTRIKSNLRLKLN